jgi:hypothetical protein
MVAGMGKIHYRTTISARPSCMDNRDRLRERPERLVTIGQSGKSEEYTQGLN